MKLLVGGASAGHCQGIDHGPAKFARGGGSGVSLNLDIRDRRRDGDGVTLGVMGNEGRTDTNTVNRCLNKVSVGT